jgi:hypothetical protein
MYIQHIQGLYQFRLSTADHVLLYACRLIKVKVTLRLTVSQSVSLGVESHLGLMTRYLLLFDNCGLTRGPVCLLYMLLALASAVFLGSESLGSRDHILLSQF